MDKTKGTGVTFTLFYFNFYVPCIPYFMKKNGQQIKKKSKLAHTKQASQPPESIVIHGPDPGRRTTHLRSNPYVGRINGRYGPSSLIVNSPFLFAKEKMVNLSYTVPLPFTAISGDDYLHVPITLYCHLV